MDLLRSTFPNSIVNIKDESGGQRVTNVNYPLHRPIVFLRAAQGDDKLEWLTGRQAYKKYGEQTFDQYEPYWRGEQYLLTNCFFGNQGVYIKRIIPPDAKVSTMVIEGFVIPDIDIPQYRRDADGRFVYDEVTGEPIVEKDSAQNPVYRRGCKVKYRLREMSEQEIVNGYKNIPVRTVSDGTVETKIYPIAAAQFKTKCKMGNKSGFKLYIDMAKQSQDLIEATGSLLWTFVPMQQPYNSNVAYEIKDKFETTINQMVMRPNQLDPYTMRRISAEDTITRLFYNEASKEYLLPFDVHFYADNIEEIGDIVRSYETDNAELTSGWMVNIATFTDSNGNPYKCAALDDSDPDCIRLSNLSLHYLSGGSDGDLSDAAFEDGMRKVLTLRVDPEIGDRWHYRITHMYDIGYSLETKFAMTDFMAEQGYMKIIMAAQDASRHLYSMDEAVSVAAAIRARCAITPESELYGTPAMRATIFAQSGYVNDTSIKNIIPMTFWAAERRASFHNAPYIKGSWAANPANVVGMYRDLNFIPYSPSQKQLLWDGAANYLQWGDDELFMPAVRSIYNDTTSLLCDDEFTDACIYTKYIVDTCWKLHVSRKVPFTQYQDLVQKEIVDRCYKAFGDQYDVTCRVYLSEEDLQNHDTVSIEIGLEGDYPKRIWNTTIIARGRSEATGG